jgi:hypothetical protein
MSIFDKFDIETLIEKAMEHIDMEAVTRDVMSKLILKEVDLYFVVERSNEEIHPCIGTAQVLPAYTFLGMAYSESAAKKLADEEDADGERAKILRFDMGALVTLVEKLGATKEIWRI